MKELRHKEVLRLATLGYSNDQIGRATGLAPTTVSKIVNDPDNKTILDELSGKRDKLVAHLNFAIANTAIEAARRLHEVITLREGTVSDQVRASLAIIDKVLPSAGEPESMFTADDIEAIKAVSRAMAAERRAALRSNAAAAGTGDADEAAARSAALEVSDAG